MLRSQLSGAQSSLQKAEADGQRLTKAFAGAREASDVTKSENERLGTQFVELKTKHETEVALVVRQLRGRGSGASCRVRWTLRKGNRRVKGKRLHPRLGSPADGGGFTLGGRYGDDADDDEAFGGSLSRRRTENSALLPPDFFTSNQDSVDPQPVTS